MGWNEALNAFLGLFDFAKNLIKMVGKIISMIPKLFSIFLQITDPIKLMKDAIFGITSGIVLIFNGILDTLFGDLANKYKITLSNDKNKKEKENCIQPTFIELLILILCPPLAIFIRKGLKGTTTILITTLLTCFYYFPGVIFASLYIL